jgi:hypothetical protein
MIASSPQNRLPLVKMLGRNDGVLILCGGMVDILLIFVYAIP